MAQAVGAKVPFTTVNISRCMCPQCPVQSQSSCASGRLSTIGESLKKRPLQAADIPGVYCSTGVATCQDLNQKQSCICGTCAVFNEYQLAGGQPSGYFCTSGPAR